jgi:hypothetical protein
MPGRGAFERCVESVSKRGGAYSPRGVCATAGRRKYGKKKFQAMAAAGRRKAARRSNIPLDPVSLGYTGQLLDKLEKEREKLQRKLERQAKNIARMRKRTNQKLPKTIWSRGTIWKKRPKSKANKNNRGRRPNPRNPVPAAQARYESFHGRPSTELIDVHTSMHEHSVLSGLGELVKLVVIAADGTKVTIKNFGVDAHGQPCILSQNEEATQLFIDGGDQSVELSEFGIYEPYHEMETLGQVRNVYYFTTKDHLGDQGGTATYNHKFGGFREVRLPSGRVRRKRSPLPDLIYDTRNKLLYFSGGGYSLPDEGIDG